MRGRESRDREGRKEGRREGKENLLAFFCVMWTSKQMIKQILSYFIVSPCGIQ